MCIVLINYPLWCISSNLLVRKELDEYISVIDVASILNEVPTLSYVCLIQKLHRTFEVLMGNPDDFTSYVKVIIQTHRWLDIKSNLKTKL